MMQPVSASPRFAGNHKLLTPFRTANPEIKRILRETSQAHIQQAEADFLAMMRQEGGKVEVEHALDYSATSLIRNGETVLRQENRIFEENGRLGRESKVTGNPEQVARRDSALKGFFQSMLNLMNNGVSLRSGSEKAEYTHTP